MALTSRSIKKFAQYTFWSTLLFIPEFALFILLDLYTPFHYVTITIGTFVFGITMQYALVRHFVFSESARHWHSGYALFFTSSCIGAGLVVLLMIVFVEMVGIPKYIARVLAGAAVGYLVYLFNLYATFKEDPPHCPS
jgi:putative flippase GtrA